MEEKGISIRWSENEDGGIDISVSADINYQHQFKEAFLAIEKPYPLYLIGEKEISGENAKKSAAVTILSNLLDIIRNADKTEGKFISEEKRNEMFPFTDLIPIRNFARIAGVTFDERRFHTRKEFQAYFRGLLKQKE